jgi:YesN/AraC family two-component response regulator
VQFLGHKLELVIVDDEPLFCNSLRNFIIYDDILRNFVNVFEVSSAERAIELLQRTRD